jgi:hypothetical protein
VRTSMRYPSRLAPLCPSPSPSPSSLLSHSSGAAAAVCSSAALPLSPPLPGRKPPFWGVRHPAHPHKKRRTKSIFGGERDGRLERPGRGGPGPCESLRRGLRAERWRGQRGPVDPRHHLAARSQSRGGSFQSSPADHVRARSMPRAGAYASHSFHFQRSRWAVEC